MKQILKLFKKSFPNIPFFIFLLHLRVTLVQCDNILDIGCGAYSPLAFLDLRHTVGLDGYKPNIVKARKNRTHTKYFFADVKKINKLFKPKSFDAVVALDFIEHLPKKEGMNFLKNMEKIARKKIVLFTPNGFLPQQSFDGNLEEHKSGWNPRELRSFEFKVYGMYGPKFLRGNDYGIRFKPKFFWGILAELLNVIYFSKNPKKAKALFCIKSFRDTV